MNKIKEAIKDLRNINTNDPAMQVKVVKALEAIEEALGAISAFSNEWIQDDTGRWIRRNI